jgi:hypothetical protein
MTADEWLDNLEAEGVDVRGYQSWRTYGRDAATGKIFGPVNGVVIHHTAGTDSLVLCYTGITGLPGPLCHTHLAKTGVANMLSIRRANHAGTFAQNAHNAVLAESAVHPAPDSDEPVDGNDHYYGIEIENFGNGTDSYPWKQYVAAVKWATAICRHHGWTENSVIGHKEGTTRKIDPKGPVAGPDGTFQFTMARFRADVADALALPAGVWPNQEEDMALSAEDVTKVAAAVVAALTEDAEGRKKLVSAIFRTDNVVDSPDGSADPEGNLYWWAQSYLRENHLILRDVQTDQDALATAVSRLSTGGVDLDALAAKVADKLAERLAE